MSKTIFAIKITKDEIGMTMNRQFKKQTFVFGILNNLPNLYFGRSPRQNMTV